MASEHEELAAYHEALARDLLVATHLSMWEVLRRTTQRFPDRPALADGDESVRYDELSTRVLRCAASLQALGVGHGTRVALMFAASLEWAVVHYALARLGAVAVPLNLAYERDEIAHVLRLSAPRLVLGVSAHRGIDLASKLAEVDAGLPAGRPDVVEFGSVEATHLLNVDIEGRAVRDTTYERLFGVQGAPGLPAQSSVHGGSEAYLIFTSGSTAAPKPALCTHRMYTGSAVALRYALGLDETDRFLSANATFHTGGVVWNLSMPHCAGAAGHLLASTDAGDILHALERLRITTFSGFDTKYTRLMAHPEWGRVDLSSVKKGNVGCTPSFMKTVEEAWPYETLAQVYGSTESGGVGSITPFVQRDKRARREANGMPVPGMEFKIVDPESGKPIPTGEPGEMCFRGWGRFVEYVGMPVATAEAIDADGFFHSGDYGWLGEDGSLYFRGRFKQMIKTGGENVAEREVEIFLETELGAVRCAQVVGVPHQQWGEAVVAFVEQFPGQEQALDALREGCRGHIAGFKIPKHFISVEPGAWPILGSGRIDKHALRKRAREELAAEVTPTVAQGRPEA